MKKRDDVIPTPDSAQEWGAMNLTTKVYSASEVETKLGALSTAVSEEIAQAVSTAYKYKGSVAFAELPTTGMKNGDVYNVTDEFTLDGNKYPAGTDVAWIANASEQGGGHWNALGGKTFDDSGTVKSVNGQTPDNSGAVTIPAATQSASGVMSASDKTALDTHVANGDIHVTTANKAAWNAKYDLPTGGVPKTDLASGVQASLDAADSAYQKPATGIPSTDMSEAVQASLALADTAIQSHQDISGKADKDTDAVVGNFAAFDSNGNPVDSGHKHSDYITAHQDITGKADKVANATTGDFAGLDANGNLTDSGKKASDFAAASHTHGTSDITGLDTALAGKQDTISDLDTIRAGAAAGATAYQKPSTGIPSTDMATAVQTSLGKADTALQASDITGKADKVANATSGNFAGLDANGNLTDSGSKASDFATASALSTHTGDSDIHVTAADKTAWNGKQDAISDLATIRSGAAAGATAVQPATLTAHTGDTDIHVTTADKATWNGKQDAISDLATIRSNAATGVTANTKVSAINAAAADLLTALNDTAGASKTMATANDIKAVVEALVTALKAFAGAADNA